MELMLPIHERFIIFHIYLRSESVTRQINDDKPINLSNQTVYQKSIGTEHLQFRQKFFLFRIDIIV